jgi:four helix bundle protein
MELSVDIYNITSQYPKTEVFGLVSQMRRAAVSVVSNIAEGAGRNSPKEFIRFLSYAQASSTELETQLLLSTQVGLIELPAQKSIEEKLLEVQKMNRALQTKINQNISKKER